MTEPNSSRTQPARSFPGRPRGIVSPHGADFFEIAWPDGTKHRLPTRILRGYCPCAGCQGHGGEIRYQAGSNSEIREIRPVGNYALSLGWGDSHDSGIYSFEYLFLLGDLHERLGTEGLIELEVLPRGRTIEPERG